MSKANEKYWVEYLHDAVRSEIWRKTHVNREVRAMRRDGLLDASPDHTGKFTIKDDPALVALA